MKNKRLKKVLCALFLSMIIAIQATSPVKAITMEEKSTILDSTDDNPVAGQMSTDDYENGTLGRMMSKFKSMTPEINGISTFDASAKKKVSATATLRYTIKNMPKTLAMQDFYIGSTYLYVIQRTGNDSIINRCTISGNTATYKDCMILKNFGHTQTLEYFEYNSKAYFWVGCKANTAYDKKWSMQIGRIQYSAGSTISDYTSVCRFSEVNCANKSATAYGSVKRVEAAVSSDKKYLVIWMENTSNNVQISYYNTTTLNKELDKKINVASKFISFKGNATLKGACKISVTQTGNNIVRPNDSNQGIAFTNEASIYMTGGAYGETPKIAKMTGSKFSYSYLMTISGSGSGEIEGIQLKGDYVYFGKYRKTQTQYIYSVPKSKFS